eukprot:gene585-8093_t
MEFSIDFNDKTARSGTLTIEKNKYKTPLYMVYTRNGVVPNITCDLLEGLLKKKTILQMSIWDVVAGSKNLEKYKMEKKKSVKSYFHFENFDVFLHTKDALHGYSNTKVSQTLMTGMTLGGSKQISVEEYIQFIKLLEPEMFVSIHDVESKKEKSLEWLKKMNSQLEKEKINSNMFAHIYAKKDPKDTIKQFSELINKNVKGFSFSELGINYEESFKLLDGFISGLKDFSSLPRLISGYDHPKLVLEAVERGMDLFDGTYPFISAEFGQAMIFPFSIYDKKQDLNKNLRDLSFQKSKEPLLIGCECLACKDHTCGYIHHLLNTKELLGHVLLT